MENIINEIKKLVKKAQKNDEVPVGAIIVYKNKIISKAYNKRNIKNNVLWHAEIEVIQKAAKKLKNWRLNDCIMYVTLKPCDMCMEVIKASRIKKIYYLTENNKTVENKVELLKFNDQYETEYSKILSDFFKNKR